MNHLARRVLAIARKEILNLVREPRTLMVSFAEPVVLLILFGFCISFDLSRLPIAVWDQDRTAASRSLVRALDAGQDARTFRFLGYVAHPAQIEPLLASGEARVVLVIPRGYGRTMAEGRLAQVQALVDGADANTAGVTSGYLGLALAAHNVRLTEEQAPRRHGPHGGAHLTGAAFAGSTATSDPIDIRWRVFYNPDLSSRRFIIPGLIAVLLSILAATLTSTTITRERELGSLESLLTSPVSALQLVLGKMLPYFLIAAVNVTIILILGGVLFGVWARGSIFTLALFTLLFLPGMLSMGILISAVAPTQQFALVLATLIAFLPTMFLTGFAFPRSNMADIIQAASWPLPATQYLLATRGIFLKGIGLEVLWPQAAWLIGSGTVLFALAVLATRANLSRGVA